MLSATIGLIVWTGATDAPGAAAARGLVQRATAAVAAHTLAEILVSFTNAHSDQSPYIHRSKCY